MWNKNKEEMLIDKITETKKELLYCMNFVETQLTEYAAKIDYDFFEHQYDNSTELLDFFEWYMDEKLHETVEMYICINIINFLFFESFDVWMFESEGDE